MGAVWTRPPLGCDLQDAPYLLYFGDADEIPSHTMLGRATADRTAEYDLVHAVSGGAGFVYLEQSLYMYSLSLRLTELWHGAVVATDRLVGRLWDPARTHGHVTSLSNVRHKVCACLATPRATLPRAPPPSHRAVRTAASCGLGGWLVCACPPGRVAPVRPLHL
jgi:hypothetical protein